MDNKSIQIKVAENIKASGANVEAIVVQKLVELEVVKRTELIIQALSKLETDRKQLLKINKPDLFNYTAPGVKGDGVYSESRNKEIVSLTEKIDKLSKATDLALDNNDGDSYNKLSELLKQNQGQSSGGAKEQS